MTATLLEKPRPSYELVSRHDGRAPRYTSYPTAVQFTPTVDARTYKGWLNALPAGEPVSLYAHIPFCARLCWYCGCNTRAVNRHDPVEAYVGKLVEEIRLVSRELPGPMPASAIHLGGGTPNMRAISATWNERVSRNWASSGGMVRRSNSEFLSRPASMHGW